MTQALSRERVRNPQVAQTLAGAEQYATAPSHPARLLLAEVVARLNEAEAPKVQVMAACSRSDPARVAMELAVAAVYGYGRTLLLTDGVIKGAIRGRNGPRLVGKASAAMTPDANVPGLYHRSCDDAAFDLQPTVAQTGRASAKAFRMLVLSSHWPAERPSGLAYAPRCHGTILAVAAGLTLLDDLMTTARQIERAGGTLLGTVLYTAPRRRVTMSFHSA